MVTFLDNNDKINIDNNIAEVRDTINNKMSKDNPTGTGSFSLNRKANTSIGIGSFTAGFNPTASGDYSHAEGSGTTASNNGSHSEGSGTTASGNSSHAEGGGTKASGDYSHSEGSGTTASGNSSHAEGGGTTASGDYSHAEGTETTASGSNAHTEGYQTKATLSTADTATQTSVKTAGYCTHAEGYGSVASGAVAHAEGNGTKASGNYSHSEGSVTTASGMNSHSEGGGTAASGSFSHAEGSGTTASGSFSHAEGSVTTASGLFSHAEGSGGTRASGNSSHAEGCGTTASGNSSHAEGYVTTALGYQHAQGHYNNTTTATAGEKSGTTGTAFVIGNGTSESATSNAFRVQYDGAVYAKAAYNASGADYAEYFEWFDGNPLNEDRRGYFVTLYGNKITIADKYDYVLGIVSGQPSVIGNSDEEWMGRYITDEFGAFIMEEFEYEVTKSNKTVEIKKGMRYKENPNYDNSLPYVQRADRPEWSAVGMLGVLAVRDDGTCEVNGFAEVADGGIATAAEGGYRVIERVSDNVVKIIFK